MNCLSHAPLGTADLRSTCNRECERQLGAAFCLQVEASYLQWSFLLTVVFGSCFFLHSQHFLLALLAFLLTVGKVRLIGTLKDCKRRSSIARIKL